MADSILRLKVDSQEYDNKLKRAAEGLQRYADGCRKAGGTLTQLDDGVLEFTKALGQMETVSKSAKGSISEMTKAFTDMSVQYNKLTDEEKQSPFGKALAESLDQLKGRIQSGNSELKSIGDSLNNTGGFLNTLKDKFTINIDALKLFNIGVQGAKAALDVAKDAFFASEASVDEWGRTMKSAESLYQGFLTAINTGDISGFLTRMDEIVKAARAAYDEMDKLGTMKTIQSPQFAKQEAENNRLRTMIMTGRWISAGDGRDSLGLKTGDKLSKEQIKVLEGMLQNGMKTIVSLTKNELDQTGNAIDAYYNSLAKQNGMTMDEFRKGTSNWAEFSKRMNDYQKYLDFEQRHTSAVTMQSSAGAYTQQVRDNVVNPYEDARKWGVFRVDKMGSNSYNDLVNLIKQQQSQQSQMYSTLGQTYGTINRAEGFSVRQVMGGGGGGGSTIKVPTVSDFEKILTKSSLGADSLKGSDFPNMMSVWGSATDELKEKILGLNDATKELGDTLGNTSTWTLDFDPYKNYLDQSLEKQQKMVKGWQTASMAINVAGNALGALKNPAIDIMTVIGQAVATIGLAYAETLAKDVPSKTNIWSFIAAASAATISMVSTIASLHSATGYAEGGEIKGNSYSGDNLMAMGPSGLIGLNAGEIVLNKAQQSTLAQNLQGAGGNMRLQAVASGEQLWFVMNAHTKRKGYGEIVTWR